MEAAGDPLPLVAGAGEKPKRPPPKRPPPKRFVRSPIPDSILNDPALNAAISVLPPNYNFEVHKTVHRVRSSSARLVVLQLPDGLQMYATHLADIIRTFTAATDVVVLGEPTYGACCLGDHAAAAIKADLLIHYGHSCLVPVTSSLVPCLYVFVEILFDASRMAAAIKSAFPSPSLFVLAGTVQFISSFHAAKSILSADGYDVYIPQSKPLSQGEVLGCTAPTIPASKGIKSAVFVADGRFHLEALMIANPGMRFFRYDPYLGVLILEEYDREGMLRVRKDAILAARRAMKWGVIFGTLGRQGNTHLLDRVLDKMDDRGLIYTLFSMSEISPPKVDRFSNKVDAWVQIACPRLSIDWGEEFAKPVLTTFEFSIALGYEQGWWEKGGKRTGCGDDSICCQGSERTEGKCSCSCSPGGCGNNSCGCNSACDTMKPDYPMDYYSQDGGDWNSSYVKKKSPAGEVWRHTASIQKEAEEEARYRSRLRGSP